MDIDLKKETKRIASDTINSTIMSIQIGFTLATALAFNEYIKKLLASSMNKQGANGYLKYALTVALVSGIVLSITNRYVRPRMKIEEKIMKEIA
jgi:hypothetical protein